MNISPPPGNAGPGVMVLGEDGGCAHSIHVGNLGCAARTDKLDTHVHGCGSGPELPYSGKFSGHSKGFAYIEFSDSR